MLSKILNWIIGFSAGAIIVIVCSVFTLCVGEIASLRGRVRDLENAAPIYPEITITIPDDWVK
jgi:hypothetical protein